MGEAVLDRIAGSDDIFINPFAPTRDIETNDAPKSEEQVARTQTRFSSNYLEHSRAATAQSSKHRRKVKKQTLRNFTRLQKQRSQNDGSSRKLINNFDFRIFVHDLDQRLINTEQLQAIIDKNETKFEKIELTEEYFDWLKLKIENGQINNYHNLKSLMLPLLESEYESAYYQNFSRPSNETVRYKECLELAIDKGLVTSPEEFNELSFFPWPELIEKAIDAKIIKNYDDFTASLNTSLVRDSEHDESESETVLGQAVAAAIFKNIITKSSDYLKASALINKHKTKKRTYFHPNKALDFIAFRKGLISRSPEIRLSRDNYRLASLTSISSRSPYFRYLLSMVREGEFSKEEVDKLCEIAQNTDQYSKGYEDYRSVLIRMNAYKAGVISEKPKLDEKALRSFYSRLHDNYCHDDGGNPYNRGILYGVTTKYPNFFEHAFETGVITSQEEFDAAFSIILKKHRKYSQRHSISFKDDNYAKINRFALLEDLIFSAQKRGFIKDLKPLLEEVTLAYWDKVWDWRASEEADEDIHYVQAPVNISINFLEKAIKAGCKFSEEELNSYIKLFMKNIDKYHSNNFESFYALSELVYTIKDYELVQNDSFYSQQFDSIKEIQEKSQSIVSPESQDEIARLTLRNLDSNFSSFDINLFKSIQRDAAKKGLSFTVLAKIKELELYKKLKIQDPDALAKLSKERLDLIEEVNSKVEEHAQIDLENMRENLSQALVNLEVVAPRATKSILDNLLKQRQYLPMLEEVMKAAAFVSPDELIALKAFRDEHRDFLQKDPNFIVDLLGYLNAFKQFGLNIFTDKSSFTEILNSDYSNSEDLICKLGLVLIEEMASERNLDIEIDFDKVHNNKSFIKEWDLKYLGTLVAAIGTDADDEFKLLIKAKLEGNEAGLVSPKDYKAYPLELYGDYEELAQEIRRKSLFTLRAMENKGIDLNLWLNAHEDSVCEHFYTLGREQSRKAVNIAEDLKIVIPKFFKWLNKLQEAGIEPLKQNLRKASMLKIRSIAKKLQESDFANCDPKYMMYDYDELLKLELNKLKASFRLLQDRFSSIERHLKDISFVFEDSKFLDQLSKKPQKLITGHDQNYAWDQIESLLNELEKIDRLELPESFYDLNKLMQEIRRAMDDTEQAKEKNYRIRFADPKDIGHLLFIGNRANSCTAMGGISTANFDFITHQGTKRLVIEDLSETLNSPDGKIKGYKRIFAGEDKKGEALINLDSSDGVMADIFDRQMTDYLSNFISKLNPSKKINSHLSELRKPGLVKGLIGGDPGYGYFHHCLDEDECEMVFDEMELPDDPVELEALDNWEPKGGWQEIAA